MKFINKNIVALIVLLGVGQAFGYRFHFTNMTGEPLVVRLQERAKLSGRPADYGLVMPDKGMYIETGNLLCLESLSWAKYDPKERLNGKNLQDILNAAKAGKGFDYNSFTTICERYGWTQMTIKMVKNEVYKETAKAAAALCKGLDTLACQVIETTKDFMGLTAAEKAASGLGGKNEVDQAKEDAIEEARKAREALQELRDVQGEKDEAKKKKAEQKAELAKQEAAKAAEAAKLVEKLAVMKAVDSQLFELLIDMNSADFDTRKVKVPAAITLVDKNKAEIVALFGQASFDKIMQGLNAGSEQGNNSAMDTFNQLIKAKSKEAESTTKTSIDVDSQVVPCPCGVNTNMDTTEKPADKQKCRFGLGKIASASAAITGISICKDRNVMIIPNRDKDGNIKQLKIQGVYTGKPEYFAFTARGE